MVAQPKIARLLCTTFIAGSLMATAFSAAAPRTIEGGRLGPLEAMSRPMDIALFTDRLVVQATGGDELTAQQFGADGLIGYARTYAATDGPLALGFRSAYLGGATPSYLRPGDRIAVWSSGTRLGDVVLPGVYTDVDVSRDIIGGIAPPGTEIALRLVQPGGGDHVATRQIVTGADGRFAADFSGVVDLQPGDRGDVALADAADGVRLTNEFAAPSLRVELGSYVVTGVISLGFQFRVAVTAPDGTPRRNGDAWIQAEGSPAWQVRTDQPIEAGDTVVLAFDDRLLPGTPAVVTALLPALTLLSLDPGTDEVAGSGPPSQSLALEVFTPSGTVRVPISTGPDGLFRTTLSGVAPLEAGTEVALVFDAGNGITVARHGVAGLARLWPGTRFVSGIVAPGQPSRVTLRDGMGAVKGSADSGWDAHSFVRSLGARIDPGDLASVELTGRAPVTVTVPALTARADADRDVVFGQAPPGAGVWVYGGMNPEAEVRHVVADASGRYAADFGSAFDIAAGGSGFSVMPLDNQIQVAAAWSVPLLQVGIGSAVIQSAAPVGRPITVTLRSAAGRTVVAHTTPDEDFASTEANLAGSRWSVRLRDARGADVAVGSDDVFEVEIGTERTVLTVPPIDANADVENDAITGRTAAGARVEVRVDQVVEPERAVDRTEGATAGPDGRFEQHFGNGFDLRNGDIATVTVVTATGHRVRRRWTIPNLRLRLDVSEVTGSAAPNARVDIAVRGTRGLKGSVEAKADPQGAFTVRLSGRDGRPLKIEPGDVLEVDEIGLAQGRRWRLTVPELALAWDATANTISGRANPDSHVFIKAFDPFGGPEAGLSDTLPILQADGTFTATLLSRVFDIRPGVRLHAWNQQRDGHVVEVMRYLPLARAQIGGARVDGVAQSFGPAEAMLVDGSGQTIARGMATANDQARYSFRLTSNGVPAVTAPGQTLRAILAGEAVEIPLLPISFTMDRLKIEGQGPPASRIELRTAGGCRPVPILEGARIITADANGRFSASRESRAPGMQVMAGYITAAGHVGYVMRAQPLALNFVGTPRVAGCASPLAKIEVVLRDENGEERARGEGQTDTDGTFAAELRDRAGRAVAIGITDQVVIQAPDADPQSVSVAALTLTRAADGSLTGQAPSGTESVILRLWLASGEEVVLPYTPVDDQGRFGLTNQSRPSRAAWLLSDVRMARAFLETPNQHFTVVEVATAVPGIWVYLPIARRER